MALFDHKNQKKKGYISNTLLILIAFASAFFPRILEALGAPKLINFAHFVTVPIVFLVAIVSNRTKDTKQIVISQTLLGGLLFLLTAITASAFVNEAGIVNVFLNFLMLGEPIMVLLAIVCIPMSTLKLKRFKGWVTCFALINLILALIQWPLVYSGHLYRGTYGEGDAIQGVFYLSGAGNYVSVSISICFALYYFYSFKAVPLWWRVSILAASFWQLLISDSKQTLVAFFVAWTILSLTKVKNIGKLLSSIVVLVLSIYLFLWCVKNLESFGAFSGWLNRMELYGPEGEATLAKIGGVKVILSYLDSPLNWLFGLGPGHTVGRLGGWMIEDYWNLLSPLGATMHPASQDTWQVVYDSWVAKQSTMFSPFFGWAGIWGDLGFFGLAAYLYLAIQIWRYLCIDDISRFFLLSIGIIGFIFTQMEEPGYMISMAILIGLKWQEKRLQVK